MLWLIWCQVMGYVELWMLCGNIWNNVYICIYMCILCIIICVSCTAVYNLVGSFNPTETHTHTHLHTYTLTHLHTHTPISWNHPPKYHIHCTHIMKHRDWMISYTKRTKTSGLKQVPSTPMTRRPNPTMDGWLRSISPTFYLGEIIGIAGIAV